MKSRDLFGVGIRLFGVWMLLVCLEDLRTIVEILLHVFNPARTPMTAYVTHAIVNGIVGVYLLSGAPFVCNVAFPRTKNMQCDSCGYDLTGNTSGTCPECGTKLPEKSGQE